jgi:hypothetical protein
LKDNGREIDDVLNWMHRQSRPDADLHVGMLRGLY